MAANITKDSNETGSNLAHGQAPHCQQSGNRSAQSTVAAKCTSSTTRFLQGRRAKRARGGHGGEGHAGGEPRLQCRAAQSWLLGFLPTHAPGKAAEAAQGEFPAPSFHLARPWLS